MALGLDLLLVNVGSSKKRIYQSLSQDYSAIEPPFWAALSAGFIRDRGYSVKILDANAENLTHEETSQIIKEYSPRLTNIVVYGQQPAASTQLMGAVGDLCELIKLDDPERKIILTGLHPSALPRKTIEEESCDFVCQGEGFYTILGLIENQELSKIPGLWWKKDGATFGNPRARNIENLTEELGSVAWDLLPMDKYRAHNWQCLGNLESRFNYASISTSLGCPFKCDFCSIYASFGERKIRYWDPKWVVNQFDTLAEKYGVKVIKIIDEMFVFDPKHFEKIANGIIEHGYKFNIWAYARVNTTEEEYLEKLKRAGFDWLCFGFEAGNESVRNTVHKSQFNSEDMMSVREKVKNVDINVLGNYMFGLPGDNLESMRETLDLAKELNCEWANIYCAMAYPGSKLYEEAVKNKLELPDSWADYSQHSYGCKPLPTNSLSAAEVLRFRDNAFYEYFTNPVYLNMIREKFGLEAVEHIQEMTRHKLKRKLLGD